VLAIATHKVDEVEINSSASGWAVPTAAGLFGGLPGRTNGARMTTEGVDLGGGGARLPQSLEDVGAAIVDLPGKQRSLQLLPGSVYELWWSGGGGFGDPLERDPAAVAADVGTRMVTADHARLVYGVALDEDGGVDEGETARLREAVGTAGGGRRLHVPYVAGGTWCCPRCDAALGSNVTGAYLERTDRSTVGLAEVGRCLVDPREFIDPDVHLVLCRCPSCGLAVETCLAVDGTVGEPTMIAGAGP
jgi:N-methylhydantoinase B